MLKLRLDYAQGLLTKGYAGGYRKFSCHNGLLVIEDNEYPYGVYYYGTQLKDGQFVPDAEGFVVFTTVKPVIDKDTRWKL